MKKLGTAKIFDFFLGFLEDGQHKTSLNPIKDLAYLCFFKKKQKKNAAKI